MWQGDEGTWQRRGIGQGGIILWRDKRRFLFVVDRLTKDQQMMAASPLTPLFAPAGLGHPHHATPAQSSATFGLVGPGVARANPRPPGPTRDMPGEHLAASRQVAQRRPPPAPSTATGSSSSAASGRGSSASEQAASGIGRHPPPQARSSAYHPQPSPTTARPPPAAPFDWPSASNSPLFGNPDAPGSASFYDVDLTSHLGDGPSLTDFISRPASTSITRRIHNTFPRHLRRQLAIRLHGRTETMLPCRRHSIFPATHHNGTYGWVRRARATKKAGWLAIEKKPTR